MYHAPTKAVVKRLRTISFAAASLVAAMTFASAATPSATTPTHEDLAVPRYQTIIVIVEENKDYSQIVKGDDAPTIAKLARTYGNATQFFGEVHPSEGNYVALVGGDTYGIDDDDAYYCKPGLTRPMCKYSHEPGYTNHTIDEPNLASQLQAAGLTWKGYYESIPSSGSDATIGNDPKADGAAKIALYASKHSGFMNFASVQNDPNRAEHIVGFDRLETDLAAGKLPNFALIVPNLCNEMHGARGAGVPEDCDEDNAPGLIRRGDRETAELVQKIEATPVWKSQANAAIVITFDEGAGQTREGCCGVEPSSRANFGGGHIPTIVVTNHGPRGVEDPTPYNHYSLLRTIEDAFGIHEYLGHAAETNKGVRPMLPLFKTQ